MGFTYRGNQLVCDLCSAVGGVRKRFCPSEYCPPPALCKACNKAVRSDGRWKHWHRNCAARMAASRAVDAERARRLAAGEALRGSALNAGGGLVRVWFYDRNNEAQVYMMGAETYRAIPLGVPASVADYEQHGAVWAEAEKVSA